LSANARYRNSGEKCDLLIHVTSKNRAAVEVKNAWKRWCRYDGSVGTSSAFKGYLLGDSSHPGAAHDFDKLEHGGWDRNTWLGVLVIGFDTYEAPMGDMIQELIRKKDLVQRGWRLSAHQHWPDRKNEQFRIACWFWSRQATVTPTLIEQR
jgi:hypothetical protein